mmetsp:Transcript_115003/g.330348  ORF Transcript_115003/g.330348 Transcript_115003/m.330348 type:complete len:434 (+) Transcript_115003:687-1988(+)
MEFVVRFASTKTQGRPHAARGRSGDAREGDGRRGGGPSGLLMVLDVGSEQVHEAVVVELDERPGDSDTAIADALEQVLHHAYCEPVFVGRPIHGVRLSCASLPVAQHRNIVAVKSRLGEVPRFLEHLLLRAGGEDSVKIERATVLPRDLDARAIVSMQRFGLPELPFALAHGADAAVNSDLATHVLDQVMHLPALAVGGAQLLLAQPQLPPLGHRRCQPIPRRLETDFGLGSGGQDNRVNLAGQLGGAWSACRLKPLGGGTRKLAYLRQGLTQVCPHHIPSRLRPAPHRELAFEVWVALVARPGPQPPFAGCAITALAPPVFKASLLLLQAIRKPFEHVAALLEHPLHRRMLTCPNARAGQGVRQGPRGVGFGWARRGHDPGATARRGGGRGTAIRGGRPRRRWREPRWAPSRHRCGGACCRGDPGGAPRACG